MFYALGCLIKQVTVFSAMGEGLTENNAMKVIKKNLITTKPQLTLKFAVASAKCIYCSLSKLLYHFSQLKSSIEAKTKLGKITWDMFFIYRMICTMDRVFDISNHCINPLEF